MDAKAKKETALLFCPLYFYFNNTIYHLILCNFADSKSYRGKLEENQNYISSFPTLTSINKAIGAA
ncbi:hypothetical protein IMSAGC014_01789 [Bacteroidaceae bacterium]|nr:hypothetical protein PvtlMGM2_0603 [Prevotella sp. MGM2]GFI35275.1 hypothetical protein IMSAGC014_01789 [Bacteroidaceae bacterium]